MTQIRQLVSYPSISIGSVLIFFLAATTEMFNGFSWQTRTLEVRADRLPPDLDLSNPVNVLQMSKTHSSLGALVHPVPFIPPINGAFVQHFGQDSTVVSVSASPRPGSSFPIGSGSPLPASPNPGAIVNAHGGNGKNVFVGNVSSILLQSP
jgi:hypothetical protein